MGINVKGMVQDGLKKIEAGYNRIKEKANPDIFGQAARRMGEATGTTRSGAPAPTKGRPVR